MRILFLILRKIEGGKNVEIWEKVLLMWGKPALVKVCNFIKKYWKQKIIDLDSINEAYTLFKKRLKLCSQMTFFVNTTSTGIN